MAYSIILKIIILAAVLSYGCSDSGFTGSSSKKSEDNGGSTDPGDDIDGIDVTDTTGGSSGEDIGGTGGGSSGEDIGGTGGESATDEPGETDTGIETDGSQTASTRHDLIVRRTMEDFDDLKIKIELLDSKDDVVETKTIDVPLNKDVLVEKFCRTNSKTKLNLVFEGDSTLPLSDKCVFITTDSETKTTIDVDTENFLDGVFGGCKQGEDDRIVFECPESKELIIEKF